MKHFDPSIGWKSPVVSLGLEKKSRPKGSANDGDDKSACHGLDAPGGEHSAATSTVFHFSRFGNPLHISGFDTVDGDAAAVEDKSAPAAEPAQEVAQGSATQSPLALLSFSTAIKEMFSALAIRDGQSNELQDVVESMRHLSVKLDEKQRLEEILGTVNAEIASLRNTLDERVLAAHELEKQALTASKVRVELMQELVSSLVMSGEVRHKK
jgi:hypothetical protein